MKKGIVYGVSLGPGDPELITLKGLKVLQSVDRIYYPGSLVNAGKKKSYSLQIMEYYELPVEKFVGFFLEMSLDRIQVQTVYKETFLKIEEDIKKGLNVAIVSEGDLSTYSSFAYLLEQFQATNIPVTLIPGITSFHLGAAEIQQPLAILNEAIQILPRLSSTEVLEESIVNNQTVVLMKIRSVMKYILPVIQREEIDFTYCEHLGTETQYISSSIQDLTSRAIPYFSLLIIKKRKN